MSCTPLPNPFVARLRLLSTLTEAELGALDAACTDVRRFKADHDLVRKGSRPECLHVVLDGWACRRKVAADGGRQISALLLPGDICDLDALHVRRLDYNVSTLTPCTIAVIEREAALDLVERHPAVGRALMWLAFVENATLTEWNFGLGRRSAREHLAHLFCELLVRLTVVGRAEADGYTMPLTQDALADVLGLTSGHVSRMLQSLRTDELVELEAQRLTVRDWGGLKAAGDFRGGYLHLQGMRS